MLFVLCTQLACIITGNLKRAPDRSYEGARGPPIDKSKGPGGPLFELAKGPTGPQLK
jgi:hypothetical protein